MLLLALLLAAQPATIPLEGTWRFRLDAEKSGLQLNWQNHTFSEDSIFLPGSTDQAGFGLKTHSASHGHLSRPFTYEGPAWYQRDVTIPDSWRGKHIRLFLERPHWQSQLFIDGRPQGPAQNSLATPHLYDTTLTPGRHTLTLLIDNSYKIDVGRNAHSVTDHTQTNWNGIVGRIELIATDPVFIDNVTITGLEARVHVRNLTGQPAQAKITINQSTTNLDIQGREAEATLPVPAPAKLWDEYAGHLETLAVHLAAGPYSHLYETQYARRDITTANRQFLLNGRPLFLRGTLECNIFPLTAYPPMTVPAWEALFAKARSYGLNHFRFHSWCPPEAAFVAADRAGFLLQIELPIWSNTVGKDPALTAFLRAEARRVLATYGNHPSFTMLALGNELRGDFAEMDKIVFELKALDNRRLYTFSSDHVRRVPGPASDYYVAHNTKAGPVRIHGARYEKTNDGTLANHTAHATQFTVPMVAHELGQWVTFPDYAEIAKYQGVLKPRNLELFRDQLDKKGMADLNRAFTLASGRFAWRLYKEDIEASLRTPVWGGVQLLQLHDFPGQGEALIGLLDSFWDSKGILTPDQMRAFFNQTVVLASFPKFTYTNDETFTAAIQIAHYAQTPLTDKSTRWALKDGDKTIAQGAGNVSVPLTQITRATQLRLEAELPSAGARNSWDIWVYPAQSNPEPADILVTKSLEAAAQAHLAKGGKVLLQKKGDMPMRFLPVFWSLTWFPAQPGHLGIYCDPAHPAFADFPTGPGSDFQWWDITENSSAFILDQTPTSFRPILHVIDDYHRNHKLGAIYETRQGNGKLLVTSLDLETNLAQRPATRQLRRSLLNYMASPAFNPSTTLEPRTELGLRPSAVSGSTNSSTDKPTERSSNKTAPPPPPQAPPHTPSQS